MRVAIFDDSQWMLDSLRRPLEAAGIEVQLTARTRVDLLADLDPDDLPDVVLLDKATPESRRDGLDLAKDLRAAYPGVGLVLISMELHVEDVDEVMNLGGDALGVISKGAISEPGTLADIVKMVGAGAHIVEKGLREQYRAHREKYALLDRLTPREEQTLDLITRGLSNVEIAGTLTGQDGAPLSVRTVETYCTGAYQKLDLAPKKQNRLIAGILWGASGRQPRQGWD